MRCCRLGLIHDWSVKDLMLLFSRGLGLGGFIVKIVGLLIVTILHILTNVQYNSSKKDRNISTWHMDGRDNLLILLFPLLIILLNLD